MKINTKKMKKQSIKNESNNNGCADVGNCFKEVITDEPKEDNYFRIKNWYF